MRNSSSGQLKKFLALGSALSVRQHVRTQVRIGTSES
jgi:hypothetical protein